MRFLIIILLLSFQLTTQGQIKISSGGENQNIGQYDYNLQTNTLTFSPGKDSLNSTAVWFNFGISGYRTDTVLTIVEETEEYVHRTNFLTVSSQNNYTRIRGRRGNGSTVFQLTAQDTMLCLSAGYPYTYTMMQNLIDRHRGNKRLQCETLLTTQNNLEVNLLTINANCGNKKNKKLVWIICRQHAFESVASYVMEGMIDYLLSPECGRKIRREYVFKIVPMVDVESVFSGQSGRMSLPRDYNRDWKNPIRPAIQLIESEIAKSAAQYSYHAFWDIHGTYPGGFPKYNFSYFDIYDSIAKSKPLNLYWKRFKEIAGFSPYIICDDSYTYNGMPADTWNKETFPGLKISSTLETDWDFDYSGRQLTTSQLKNYGKYMIQAFK